MKKRKELDALVSNGKVKKKHGGSGSSGGGGSAGASHELLRVHSDTTDTEEFSVIHSRKFSSEKGGWFSRLCTACLPVCTLTLVTACVVGSATLIWMQFGMRQEVDLLRDHMRQVEEGNKGMPSEFHGIHSQLNELQKNHTALKDEVRQLNTTFEAMSKEIAALKKTANELQKSIAEAPQLENLPKDVRSLFKSLADIGSKITAVETSLKQVDDQLGNNDKEKQTLPDRFNKLQEKVDALVADQQKPVELQPGFTNLNNDMKRLEDYISETNNTIWEKLLDLLEHYRLVHNLTQRVHKLELSPGSSNEVVVATVLDSVNKELQLLVNDTVTAAVDQRLHSNLSGLNEINGTIKISTLISYVRNLTQFYVALLARTQSVPRIQLQQLNDTLDLSFSAIMQNSAKEIIDASVTKQDATIQQLNATILGIMSTYEVLNNHSHTFNTKIKLLQDIVEGLRSSLSLSSPANSLGTHTEHPPPSELSDVSPDLNPSSQTFPPPANAKPDNSIQSTSLPLPVMNATNVTPITSTTNSNISINGSTPAPHKPVHTGESLQKQDDGSPHVQPANE